jgi:hypothetical protein
VGRPRFLADHDLRERIIVGVLRRVPAAEFVRCRDVGLASRPDPEVLEYAARQGLIVVSHDVNTMLACAYERIRDGRSIAGILMVQQAAPAGPVIDSLALIWLSTEEAEWRGTVEFLPL